MKRGHWRRRIRGTERGRLLSQRALEGGGGRPQLGRRHRKGPAPSCQFYQRPKAAVPAPRGSCNSQKQKPQGGTSPAALEDCSAPTPFTGLPGPTARGWEAQWVTALSSPAATLGCGVLITALPHLIDGQTSREGTEASRLGWGRGSGLGVLLPPHPRPGQLDSGGKSLGLAELVLTQLLGEDLLKGHLAPVLQVLLHNASDAERRGAGGPQ